MSLIKIYKEIRKIGLKNWIFFVIYLKRDEFSPKLYLNYYLPERCKTPQDFHEGMERYNNAIKRAHKIEAELSEIR